MDDQETIAVITEVCKTVQGNIDGLPQLMKVRDAVAHMTARLSDPVVADPAE